MYGGVGGGGLGFRGRGVGKVSDRMMGGSVLLLGCGVRARAVAAIFFYFILVGPEFPRFGWVCIGWIVVGVFL